MLLSLVSASFNVVISIILMKLYGIVGLGVGFALSQVFSMPILYNIFRRREVVYHQREFV